MEDNNLPATKFYGGGDVSLSGQMSVSAARAQKEVEGQIIMAKKFPRDEIQAINRIRTACKRYQLAKSAEYSYPRGGQTVSGASIRLAEVLAQNWGNLDFGIRELSQENGESTVEAYCWDLETNVKQTKIFHVKHERLANKKITKLTDPRDIYELVANNGSRRLRACILGIIPADVVELAQEECDKTIAGNNDIPLVDRIRSMVDAFSKLGVTKDMIEQRLNHKIEEMDGREVAEYGKIFNSLKDSMTKRQDWFQFTEQEQKPETSALQEKLANIVTPKAQDIAVETEVLPKEPQNKVSEKQNVKKPAEEKPSFKI